VATLASAQADADNTRGIYNRLHALATGADGSAVVTQQTVDTAKSALDSALAKVDLYQKALDLERAGARKEDIAQADAAVRAGQAQLALLRQQLQDAALPAPIAGVVRSRLMEAGEMATSQTPVFSLAVVDPKWVRTYVSEPQLGVVKPGMAASITVDAFPGRVFPGKVGFVSPVAEFTPTAVETEELRSSLVYEVRVLVQDPNDDLRLGMPATLRLVPAARPAADSGSHAP
jgi:HlyD family secretion protein